MPNKKKLIVIVGPTAVGKTEFSVSLAQQLQCEIISADSRQFYKEISIGTAKPTKAEMKGISHHFIGHLSVADSYTAGKFELDAIKKITQLFSKNDYAILIGGSGLYIDAVCLGLDDIPSDLKVREMLMQKFQEKGLSILQEELKKVDYNYYQKVDINNTHRVIRGLETYYTSGLPYSSFTNNFNTKRDFKIIKIGLNMGRENLYNRINKRVDLMLQNGLIEEAKSVIQFKNQTALKTVGYSELFDYFDGNISLEKTAELIKQNSRRYAKRQITWFKRGKKTHWINRAKFNFEKDLNQLLDLINNDTN